jgi:hypothetical protein
MPKRVFKAKGKIIGFKPESSMLVLEAMMHEGFFGNYHKIEIHMENMKKMKEFIRELGLEYNEEKNEDFFGNKPVKGRKIEIIIK